MRKSRLNPASFAGSSGNSKLTRSIGRVWCGSSSGFGPVMDDDYMFEFDPKIQRLIPVRSPIAILGVPFDNVTTSEAVAAIEQMVASRRPHYVVTANVDFLVQAQSDVELRRILTDAHLVLCDGTPLVWASRWLGNRLPERVAGSDLTPVLLKVAAEKKYRVFLLGASPDAVQQAAARLQRDHPSLLLAGYYSPP